MLPSVRVLAVAGIASVLIAGCETPVWQFSPGPSDSASKPTTPAAVTPSPSAQPAQAAAAPAGETASTGGAAAPAEETGPTDQEVYTAIVEDYRTTRNGGTTAQQAEVLARAEQLAASGFSPAIVLSGNLYAQGFGYDGDINNRKAFEYYQLAHNAGEVNGSMGMALSARKLDDLGGYTPPQILSVLRSAVGAQPSTVGHINLGRFYAEGFGAPRDVVLAETQFSSARALGAKDMDVEIGKLYADPSKPEFDPDAALRHFQADAQRGSVNAAFLIADLVSGRVDGVDAHPEIAAYALEPVAQQGNQRAAFLLGRLYSDPASPVFNPVRARELLEPVGTMNADLTLAEMYAADGPAQNYAAAEDFYRRAMAVDDDTPRFRLAVMYVRQGASRQKVQDMLAPLLAKGDKRAEDLLARVP